VDLFRHSVSLEPRVCESRYLGLVVRIVYQSTKKEVFLAFEPTRKASGFQRLHKLGRRLERNGREARSQDRYGEAGDLLVAFSN
jgi:hypothetical protein